MKFSFKLLFIFSFLWLAGCEEDTDVSPLSLIMGARSYINIDNEGSYTLSGECLGEGLEISYQIGNQAGSAYCEDEEWSIASIDLSGESDGQIRVKLFVSNGDKVLQATATLTKDTAQPTLANENIGVPEDGTYGVGEDLNFRVNLSEAVFIDSEQRLPRLTLDIGGVTKYAEYVSGSGSDTLTFRYSLVSGDADSDGIGLSSSIDFLDGSIEDIASNDPNFATLMIPSLSAVLVDTSGL